MGSGHREDGHELAGPQRASITSAGKESQAKKFAGTLWCNKTSVAWPSSRSACACAEKCLIGSNADVIVSLVFVPKSINQLDSPSGKTVPTHSESMVQMAIVILK